MRVFGTIDTSVVNPNTYFEQYTGVTICQIVGDQGNTGLPVMYGILMAYSMGHAGYQFQMIAKDNSNDIYARTWSNPTLGWTSWQRLSMDSV